MQKQVYITRLIAGLLLVVFACSITPKRFLHHLFAKHIDNSTRKNTAKPYQLYSAGYNCDTDHLVVESGFASDQQVFSFPVFTTFSAGNFEHTSYTSPFGIYSRLRGPPVNS